MKKPKRWREIIERLAPNGTLAEVGTWKGATAFHVLDARPDARVICIDPWRSGTVDVGLMKDADWFDSGSRMAQASQGEVDRIYEGVAARMAGYGDRCRILRMESAEAAKLVDSESLDMVFIDAIHTFEAVAADIAAWIDKVKKGGIIGGHDYLSDRFPGVKQAVVEAFGEGAVTTAPDHCWFVNL